MLDVIIKQEPLDAPNENEGVIRPVDSLTQSTSGLSTTNENSHSLTGILPVVKQEAIESEENRVRYDSRHLLSCFSSDDEEEDNVASSSKDNAIALEKAPSSITMDKASSSIIMDKAPILNSTVLVPKETKIELPNEKNSTTRYVPKEVCISIFDDNDDDNDASTISPNEVAKETSENVEKTPMSMASKNDPNPVSTWNDANAIIESERAKNGGLSKILFDLISNKVVQLKQKGEENATALDNIVDVVLYILKRVDDQTVPEALFKQISVELMETRKDDVFTLISIKPLVLELVEDARKLKKTSEISSPSVSITGLSLNHSPVRSSKPSNIPIEIVKVNRTHDRAKEFRIQNNLARINKLIVNKTVEKKENSENKTDTAKRSSSMPPPSIRINNPINFNDDQQELAAPTDWDKVLGLKDEQRSPEKEKQRSCSVGEEDRSENEFSLRQGSLDSGYLTGHSEQCDNEFDNSDGSSANRFNRAHYSGDQSFSLSDRFSSNGFPPRRTINPPNNSQFNFIHESTSSFNVNGYYNSRQSYRTNFDQNTRGGVENSRDGFVNQRGGFGSQSGRFGHQKSGFYNQRGGRMRRGFGNKYNNFHGRGNNQNAPPRKPFSQSYGLRPTYEESPSSFDNQAFYSNSLQDASSSHQQKFEPHPPVLMKGIVIQQIDVNSFSTNNMDHTVNVKEEEVDSYFDGDNSDDDIDGLEDDRSDFLEVPKKVVNKRGRAKKTNNPNGTTSRVTRKSAIRQMDEFEENEEVMPSKRSRRNKRPFSQTEDPEWTSGKEWLGEGSSSNISFPTNDIFTTSDPTENPTVSTTAATERYANLLGNFKIRKRPLNDATFLPSPSDPKLKSVLKKPLFKSPYINTITNKTTRVTFSDVVDTREIPIESSCLRKAADERSAPFINSQQPSCYTLPQEEVPEERNLKSAQLILPNSDLPVLAEKRADPSQFSKTEIRKIKNDIKKKIDEAIYQLIVPDSNRSAKYHNRNWFILDSLFKYFDVNKLRGSIVTNFNFPKMPEWLAEMLELEYDSEHSENLALEFGNLYCGFGFEILVRHSYARIEELLPKIINGIRNLVTWVGKFFRDKIRNYTLANPDGSNVMVSYKIDIPRVILITIPELGPMSDAFEKINERMREFVTESESTWNAEKPIVSLLDWAKLVAEKNNMRHEAISLEERMKLLMDEAHYEFGLLRQGDRQFGEEVG